MEKGHIDQKKRRKKVKEVPWLKITPNFRKLVRKLKPLSQCDQKISVVEFRDVIIPQQWRIVYSDYTEEETKCPCGKHGIKERCYIRNIVTKHELFVGNECIKRFSKSHCIIATIAKTIGHGVSLKFKEKCCSHYHFSLNARSALITKNDVILEYFGRSPVNSVKKEVKVRFPEGFISPCVLIRNCDYMVDMRIVERQNKMAFELKNIREKDAKDEEAEAAAELDQNKKKPKVISVLSDDDGEAIFDWPPFIAPQWEAEKRETPWFILESEASPSRRVKFVFKGRYKDHANAVKAKWSARQRDFFGDANPPYWTLVRAVDESFDDVYNFLNSV